jgi:hypothetical protein
MKGRVNNAGGSNLVAKKECFIPNIGFALPGLLIFAYSV